MTTFWLCVGSAALSFCIFMAGYWQGFAHGRKRGEADGWAGATKRLQEFAQVRRNEYNNSRK